MVENAFDSFEAWRRPLINFSVDEEVGRQVWREVTAAYNEDGRYYHTLDHVADVLRWAAEMKHLAHDYPAVQLAAWFHDVVYDTRSAENEARSAAFAASRLARLGIPAATIEKVNEMILATAAHTNPAGPDTAVLLDADLAILGSDPQPFAAYCAAIRREYGWVPEADYRAGRAAVLARFLERERIYHTEWIYRRLEERARENLIGEIRRLS